MSLFRAQNICVISSNTESHILKHVFFSIERGECVGIAGVSGAGKTMLMRSVLGILPETVRQTDGSFFWEETEVKPEEIRGRQLAAIFQNPQSSLDPVMRVGNQIAEVVKAHRNCSFREAKTEAVKLLMQVQIQDVHGVMRKYPYELSGGMCQRVCIAAALAGEPELIIADEPTTALDADSKRGILELLRSIVKNKGRALVLISHDRESLASVCDRVLTMQGLKLHESDLPVLSEIAHAKRDEEKTDMQHVPVISIRNVTKNFPQKGGGWKKEVSEEAVSDVSLDIWAGETVGLIGASGCGKSTLARMIAGLRKPDQGSVWYHGKQIDRMNWKERAVCCKGIQMIFQNPGASLNPRLTVQETLEDPLHILGVRDREMRLKKIREVLTAAGMEDRYLCRLPGELSGGQKQRVCIARALLLEPDFLICDESVSSLDPPMQRQMLELLEKLRKEHKMTYLFIAHDLEQIRNFCTRTAVMYEGRIVEINTTEELFNNPSHKYTKKLLKSDNM